jgi:hypothetical protein
MEEATREAQYTIERSLYLAAFRRGALVVRALPTARLWRARFCGACRAVRAYGQARWWRSTYYELQDLSPTAC